MSYKVAKLQSYKGRPVTQPVSATTAFETFENLEAYKFAREFRRVMYHVSRKLPKYEMYALGTQIRRAAVSLTNNIAEGHGRFHYPDQIRFMLQARGSLEELFDDIITCEDEAYLEMDEIKATRELGLEALRVLNGYIRYLRNKANPTALRDETVPYECVDRTDDATL